MIENTIINIIQQPTNLKIQDGSNNIINIKTQDNKTTKIVNTENITNVIVQENPSAKIIEGSSSGSGSGTYQNSNAMPISVGGYSAGTSFTTPQTIQEMLDGLLYPYTLPSISFSSNPSGSVQELGTSISSVQLNASITKKTDSIVKVEYYKNGNLIHTNSSINSNGGNDSYTDSTGINNTTSYYAKVYDSKPNSVSSGSSNFTYIYPLYIGIVSNLNPTEANVKSMTKRVVTKGNQSMSYTLSSSRFCFAYSSSYGNLSSILDPNGFEMLGSFTKTNSNFNMLDGNSVTYTIYTLTVPTTQNNFNVTYKF